MKNQITNFAISRINNVPGVESQFLKKLDYLFTYVGLENAEIKLWNLKTTFKSYGHWVVTLEMEINGEKVTIKELTTNSQMIDNFKDEEDAITKIEALISVIESNDSLLMEKYQIHD